jgi:hypothetical protein
MRRRSSAPPSRSSGYERRAGALLQEGIDVGVILNALHALTD